MDIKGVIEKLTNVKIKTPFKNKKESGGFKVAVSSGIYYAARSDEINTLVKKTGYALTRGAGAVEIASDIPHEINFSEGKEIRYISEKMEVDMLLHGDLQAPLELPDRTEWIITQNKLEKAVKSGVYGGCKYVNFHSCLREWLELFTHAGQRLYITMCDPSGNFLGKKLFKNNPKLVEWFKKTSLPESIDPKNGKAYFFRRDYAYRWSQVIMGGEATNSIQKATAEDVIDKIYRGPEVDPRIRETLEANGRQPTIEEKQSAIIQSDYKNRIKLENSLVVETRKQIVEAVGKHLLQGLDWHQEDKFGETLDDAYYIVAHNLFLNQDPLWKEMAVMYKDFLSNYYYNFDNPLSDDEWLDKAYEKANSEIKDTSILFKEFYYGVVAAKYLQGHIVELAEWMKDDNGLKKIISREIDAIIPSGEQKKRDQQKKILFENLKDFLITFEVPDARNPEFGGRYMLWRPKQILAAVKHIREALENLKGGPNPYHDKIFMIIDWEHVATQGVDPFDEAEDLIDATKRLDIKVGDYIIGIHANYPSPLQPHKPIDIADRIVIYELLWKLRKDGDMGRKHVVYLLFERGGGDDPFRGSVIALRTISENLAKDIPPEKLPETFFAISEGTRDWARQRVHIFQHAFEPLKGQLRSPEEEHTLLSSAALKAGKRPEDWLKEELR